jgi:hypothetical protein
VEPDAMETLTAALDAMTLKEEGEKKIWVDDLPENRLGLLISADGDNFVYYSKFGNTFAVTKGLAADLDDSDDLYENEIAFQEDLAKSGLAPRVLAKNIVVTRKGMKFNVWISEDAGLPVTVEDIPDVNEFLDILYERGIILYPYTMHPSLFVRGFDGKIRATDFKQTEEYDEPIGKHNRRYLSTW